MSLLPPSSKRGVEQRLGSGGDRRPTEARLAHSCFAKPTLLNNVAREMSIWRSEAFGSVPSVCEVERFDEAVVAANDFLYGAAFTSSLRQVRRFAEPAYVMGRVAVNITTSGRAMPMPDGGLRQSGSAFKEQGLDALRIYSRSTDVAIGHA